MLDSIAPVLSQVSIWRWLYSICFLFILNKFYLIVMGPLASLPGPKVSLVTNLVFTYHVLVGRKMFYVDSLHKKYGPVVRISPREAIVSDPQSAKDIHKMNSEFVKSPWYGNFIITPLPPLFAETNPAVHRSRKKILGKNMTETYLANFEVDIKAKIERAVGRMRHDVDQLGFADVAKWWSLMTSDVISLLAFGKSFDDLERTAEDLSRQPGNKFLNEVRTAGFIQGLADMSHMPVWLGARLNIPPFSQYPGIAARTQGYTEAVVQRLKAQDMDRGQMPTLFSNTWSPDGDSLLSDAIVSSEAGAYVIAGSDSTATTLTYLIWVMCKYPEVEMELMTELKRLGPDQLNRDLKTCLFLEQVISEILRVHGAVAGVLPRMVPKGGRYMCGQFVPGGTTVMTQAYTLHRDPEIFPNPDMFMPSRWAEPSKAMKDTMMPFGGGSTACIGEGIARMEIRMAVAAFYRAFPAGVQVASDMQDADMDKLDFFFVVPKGGRCLVKDRC